MTSPVEAMRAVGNDPVNRPQHYAAHAARGVEPIDAFLAWYASEDCDPRLCGLLWQVNKYLVRAGRKGDALTDLRKAEWYLKRAIAREEKRNG